MQAVSQPHPAVACLVAPLPLTLHDVRGRRVRTLLRGDQPAGEREIVWDGRDIGGAPAIPGLTYSYVFTARDRAGIRKRFVGEGFEVPPFRLESEAGPVLVFAGDRVDAGTPERPDALVREAAE